MLYLFICKQDIYPLSFLTSKQIPIYTNDTLSTTLVKDSILLEDDIYDLRHQLKELSAKKIAVIDEDDPSSYQTYENAIDDIYNLIGREVNFWEKFPPKAIEHYKTPIDIAKFQDIKQFEVFQQFLHVLQQTKRIQPFINQILYSKNTYNCFYRYQLFEHLPKPSIHPKFLYFIPYQPELLVNLLCDPTLIYTTFFVVTIKDIDYICFRVSSEEKVQGLFSYATHFDFAKQLIQLPIEGESYEPLS